MTKLNGVWRSAAITAAAALAIGLMGAAPAGATEVGALAAPGDVSPGATPYSASLTGSYGDPATPAGWQNLPVSTTTLTFVLPDDLRGLGITAVSVRTIADSGNVIVHNQAINAATNTLQVPIPAGRLSTTVSPTADPAYGGVPYFSYRITFLSPSGSTEYRKLELQGVFRVVDGSSTTTTSTLTRDSATAYSFTSDYRGTSEQWVTSGQTIVVPAPAGRTWQANASAVLTDWAENDVPVTATRAANGSSLTIAIPSGATFDAYLDGRSYVTIVATATEGADAQHVSTTDVSVDAVFGQSTSIAGTLSARVSGSDRYTGAIAMAAAGRPFGTVKTLYLAAGANFPDALSAGPVAAADGSTLLLVPASQNEAVARRIHDLDPESIVIVGGPNSVTPDWVTRIQQETDAPITRVGGADRYAVSRQLATDTFGTSGADHVFIATGASYPDALSAIPAAVANDAPVLLVIGQSSTLDAATVSTLDQLGTEQVTILGGPNSVSPGIQTQLEQKYPGEVTRLGGADRYAVALAVNDEFRSDFTPGAAFLASGGAFADALAGGVLAATHGSPLLLSRPECVPADVSAALQGDGLTHVTLLGGRNTLTPAVATLASCN